MTDLTVTGLLGIPFFDFFTKGGFFMLPLGICSVVSLAIILERAFALRRSRVISKQLEMELENLTEFKHIDRLTDLIHQDRSSLSRLLATAINHLNMPKSENLQAVQMQGRHEVVQLERGLVILEIIVGISPLLGLLGTLSGMIHIFEGVSAQGVGNQAISIARGISEALNVTVAGLAIAIPSMIFWSYYNSKIQVVAAEMEAICGEFLTRIYLSRD